jgi:hypothetical protein
MKFQNRQRGISLSLIAVFAFFAVIVLAGFANPKNREDRSTQRGRNIWRPTYVPVGTQFVGREACAQCHQSQAQIQQQSAMGRAMEHGADAIILIDHQQLQFRLGKYHWQIARKDKQSLYTVTDGKETISVPVLYAFGQGKAGQTYVLEYEGNFYESRLSFYNEIQGLDLTLGVPRAEPDSLAAALGRPMSKDETLQCFSCHTTGTVIGTKLHLDKMVPGVSCESCHGPGGDHVAAGKTGQPNKDKIFNPAKLNADDMAQEFCGACHRSAEEIFSKPDLNGLSNVRFQPYRIFNSKCYSDDRRISCTACHNPHESLKHDAAFYDSKCLACHETNRQVSRNPLSQSSANKTDAKGCQVGTKDCASCHMPKVNLPGAHFKFTDHRIRIAKPHESFPF